MIALIRFFNLLVKHAHPFQPKFDFELWKKHITDPKAGPQPRIQYVNRNRNALKNFLFNLRVFASSLIHSIREKQYVIEIEKDLHYVRIPKCGSTTINYLILKSIYEDSTIQKYTDDQIDLLADSTLKHVEINSRINSFAIVRNPLHRLVSAYQSIFGNQDKFIYQNLYLGIFRYNDDFSSFVQKLSCIPVSLMDQNVRPQYTFVKAGTKIFKLEDGFQPIQNLHPVFGDSNIRRNATVYSKDWWQFYDKSTFKIAESIYKEDIERFNYTNEIRELKLRILNMK